MKQIRNEGGLMMNGAALSRETFWLDPARDLGWQLASRTVGPRIRNQQWNDNGKQGGEHV